MDTLQQIENLLAPIWNKLMREKRDDIPKSFINLITDIFPKYRGYNFDTPIGRLRKIKIVEILRKAQFNLINVGALDKKRQNDLNFLIEKFSRKFSVKEQIEVYRDIGKLERAFIKDIKGDVIDLSHQTISRSENSVTHKNITGDFNMHIHPPQNKEITPYHHVPSIKDLIYEFYVLEKNKFTKFVIVATNNENKVIGYFIYTPIYNENSIVRTTSPEELLKVKDLEYKKTKNFKKYYENILKKFGISYTYKTRAMPGYYWDDKDKIFKEKPK